MSSTRFFSASLAAPLPAAPTLPVQTLVPGDNPLVLLPVRLETRFFAQPDQPTVLRVRVYPDSLHIDSHQPELTTHERNAGARYWQRDWLAGNDIAARQDAWRNLADDLGAPRAAWVVRVLQPTNIAQRPAAPVPADEPPAVPPLFPDLPPVAEFGESTWRHAPKARLLPERWVAVLHSNGLPVLSVTGSEIPRELAVGPDPQAVPGAGDATAPAAADQLALDDGMRWLVDFEQAEGKGMALRMSLAPELLAAGIDSLFVFGVAPGLGAGDAAAAQLADLLDAHHYTDGLACLRYGSPTNNTDDRRAGMDSEDRGHARSFADEVLADPAAAPNAGRLGAALGLPGPRIAPTLGRLHGAAADHDRDQRSMNTALWPVAWGYFLSNMVGSPAGMTTAAADWARQFFIDHVRAAGPLPALRCGAQPYGVLPVTSLDLWAPQAQDGSAPEPEPVYLRGLLLSLRERVWRPALDGVARIGLRQNPPDPDADLADVMRIDGVSHALFSRAMLSRHHLEHLYALDAKDFGAIAQGQLDIALKLVQTLGLATDAARLPHAAHGFLDPEAWPVTAPLVQPGEVSPWCMLEPDYIGALLATRSIQALIDQAACGSLLQALLRHAQLREIANAAARIAAARLPAAEQEAERARLLRDLPLVDLVDTPPLDFTVLRPAPTLHWRRQLDLAVPAITGSQTIRGFLEDPNDPSHPTLAALGGFRAALAHLGTRDSETLKLQMLATLDLSANRLDAWITAFATQRLVAMNADAGIVVGGYGWVENLHPKPDRAALPPEQRPAGEDGPLYTLSGDSGFIHAPSPTHAAAAALLRNAQLGPTGVPQADGAFAIDLSSRRAREATKLLEGVRQGQPLGALLGYRFERRLHELALDRWIAPLRQLAPLAVRDRQQATRLPSEALAAHNVVDGLLLLRRWQDGGDAAFMQLLADAGPADGPSLGGELEALHDAVDGLGDALTAEAAYQLARGNVSRLSSTLSAIAHGEAPPPDLEVLRSPRSGIAVTHRVLAWMSAPRPTTSVDRPPGGQGNSGAAQRFLENGQAQAVAGWADAQSSVLALAEPMLNAWAGGQLGDARAVRCTVERFDPGSGQTRQSQSFPLAELALTPLDFVHGVEPLGSSGASASSLSGVEQRVLHHAQRRDGGFGAQDSLRLQHARPADLVAGETTLLDLLEQARALRSLLDKTRGARPEDLCPPERPPAAALDLPELEARVVQGEDNLAAAHQQLLALIAGGVATTADELRAGMLALGAFGVAPALPDSAVGDTPQLRAALLKQATALCQLSAKRLAQGATLRLEPAAGESGARCGQLLERGRAVFGAQFVMLPRFTLEAAAAAELASAIASGVAQQGGDACAAYGWFTRAARVREPLARLADSLRGAEVLATGDRLALSVAQLPFDAAERWVGLPPLAGEELAAGKLSLVLQSAQPLDPTGALCGLLVDEWVEVVPSRQETTAITFQYNPPNAFAPQNILVAVPPVRGQPWTTENLRRVLAETLDLAKLRAVDTGRLGAAGQYLPALVLPFNAADDAVSTDFNALTH